MHYVIVYYQGIDRETRLEKQQRIYEGTESRCMKAAKNVVSIVDNCKRVDVRGPGGKLLRSYVHNVSGEVTYIDY